MYNMEIKEKIQYIVKRKIHYTNNNNNTKIKERNQSRT